MSFLCQKDSKQTSKLNTKQLQTIYDNIILVSETVLTDIEIENEAIRHHLWSRHSCVWKPPNRHRIWKRGNYWPFIITSILWQKGSKQTSKLKTKRFQIIYDNVIIVAESLQTEIEIGNEEITNHLW